jgi:hypothetical protein
MDGHREVRDDLLPGVAHGDDQLGRLRQLLLLGERRLDDLDGKVAGRLVLVLARATATAADGNQADQGDAAREAVPPRLQVGRT